MTIARLWRTAIDPARALDYERFAAEVSLSMFEQQPGFAGVVMMRSGSECLVLTLWESQAAVDALASSATCLETVRRIEAEGLLVGGSTLSTHGVHLLGMQPASAEADCASHVETHAKRLENTGRSPRSRRQG